MTWPPTTPSMPKWNSGLPEPQQPVLVELGGPGGPAELVVAVAPEVADHERRQAHVRDDHPQERVHQRAPGNDGIGSGARPVGRPAGLNSGVANGARPTSSSGGPSAASRRTASRSSPRSGGSVARDRVDRAGPGRARRRASASRSSSRPARWSSSSCRPRSLVDGGGELQHDAEVVGQLGVGQLEPGGAGRPA